MTQKIALVTGASSGIGAAITRALAADGYQVIAAARRLDRLEAMRAPHITPLQLDITAPESIQKTVAYIQDTYGRLDVLVNNAGYALYGVLEEVTPDEARAQFEVNIFGLMALTQALLPLMRAQRSGLIINMSSVAGRLSTPMAGWYAASKHALEALSDALRAELAPFGVGVSIIQPAAIKTEFDHVALNHLQTTTRSATYRGMVDSFNKSLTASYANAPGGEVVAQAVMKAVRARRPRPRYPVPVNARVFLFMRWLLSDRMLDRALASQIGG